VLLATLGLVAPAPAAAVDAAGLRAALARHAAQLGPASSVVVRDLGTGAELFARRPDRRLVPASNQKLYVTAGALLELGPDARLRTEVRLGPQASVDAAGIVRGDLELVGGGDPSLGDAGLSELAAELEGRGITRLTGGIVADEDLFDLRRGSVDSGWAADFDLGGSLGALVWAHGRTGAGGPGVQAALRLQSLLRARASARGGRPAAPPRRRAHVASRRRARRPFPPLRRRTPAAPSGTSARTSDPLRGLLARQVGQGAREDERAARQDPLARRRARLLGAHADRLEVLEELAHLRVGELGGDLVGHLRPDPRRVEDLLGRRREQRVDRAEALGEVAPRDLADLLEAGGEEHAAQRPVLRGRDPRDGPLRADAPEALELLELLRGQAEEVARGTHEPRLLELGHLLLAEAVDVHRPAGDEVLEELPAPVRAGEVRALREDRVGLLDRLRVADGAAAGGRVGSARSGRSTACGAGERPAG
jgi:hypothetical protein